MWIRETKMLCNSLYCSTLSYTKHSSTQRSSTHHPPNTTSQHNALLYTTILYTPPTYTKAFSLHQKAPCMSSATQMPPHQRYGMPRALSTWHLTAHVGYAQTPHTQHPPCGAAVFPHTVLWVWCVVGVVCCGCGVLCMGVSCMGVSCMCHIICRCTCDMYMDAHPHSNHHMF